ncbi:MAG: glutamine-hydrolyzing GMP synthase subunit GuaA [Methanobacteriota archaeon]|nr:MAG: glutamine-hydrolyzing GMP synthase subunit GuaA [Euryarchaeota archaeon]
MFDPAGFIEESVGALKAEVRGKALIAASGGVDSTVAAVLASRALGASLLAVFVDTGLMRKGEVADVDRTLKEMNVRHKIVDARDAFLAALKGVEDPEKKRAIIGAKFIEIFEREAKPFGAEWLVQGTIAPDWIESGGQLRDRIKTHHNVAGLPEVMRLKLAEPLRDLYKDEVRKVARALGLRVAERQPFPGPALAVRCLGEVTPEKVEIVRGACAVVEEEIVLLPIRSVGVHGDVRVYGWTVAVRAIESVDGMSGRYARIPHEVLDRISVRITNEMPNVNRVVYDVTNKPPATIEWE